MVKESMSHYPTFRRNSNTMTLEPASINRTIRMPNFVFLHGGEKVNWARLPTSAVIMSTIPLDRVVAEHQGKGVFFETLRKRRKPTAVAALNIVGTSARVRRAPVKPSYVSESEYEAGFLNVAEYLATHGVGYTTPATAADAIFRQGLTEPIRLSSPAGRAITRPSRGICYEGTYSGPWRAVDIKSAYPAAMQSEKGLLPKSAIPIPNPKRWTEHENALVFARVIVLDVPAHRSPIVLEQPMVADGWESMNPIRIAEREVYDWYFDFELRTLLERNHYVEPIYAFRLAMFDATEPLARFNKVLDVRYDPDFLGPWERKLLKQVANSWWGGLITGQMVGKLLDETGRTVKGSARSIFPGKNGGDLLAAWITAKVSDQAFRELIEPYNPVYFDTDGGYVQAGYMPPTGDRVGEWVDQGIFHSIEIAGWQAYAITAMGGKQRIVMSGVPSEQVSYADFRRIAESRERADLVKAIHPRVGVDQIYAVHRVDSRIMFNLPPNIKFGANWIVLPKKVAPDAIAVTPIAKRLGLFEAWISDADADKLRNLALAFASEVLAKKPKETLQNSATGPIERVH